MLFGVRALQLEALYFEAARRWTVRILVVA